jgi:tetratricopeptide (TPR) repeat protein
MKKIYMWLFASLIACSGCAATRAHQNIYLGRQAFFIGNYDAAQSYFNDAAQVDPNYVYGTYYRQGVWSYVGRAEYVKGNLQQAQRDLERAIAADHDVDIARLYLGLTLIRKTDREQGLREIENGMRGIQDWLNYVNFTNPMGFGQFWDPGSDIRSAIKGDLAMISGKEFNLQELVSNAEWLGKRMEEESDLASKQESMDWSRDSEGNGETR